MLCIRTYQYQSGKSTDSLIVKYILKQFIAGTIRNCMVYHGVIIHMLVLVCNGHTAKIYFRSLSGKGHFSSVTGSTVVQCHTIQQYITVCFLPYIKVTDTYRTCMRLFQFIQIEYRVLSGKYLDNLC